MSDIAKVQRLNKEIDQQKRLMHKANSIIEREKARDEMSRLVAQRNSFMEELRNVKAKP